VRSVAFAPDGRTFASGSVDNTIRLWDTATGKELRQLQGHQKQVDCVIFSPDGRRLASGSWDTTIRIWDLSAPRDK
jgi:WD40 repeat protein